MDRNIRNLERLSAADPEDETLARAMEAAKLRSMSDDYTYDDGEYPTVEIPDDWELIDEHWINCSGYVYPRFDRLDGYWTPHHTSFDDHVGGPMEQSNHEVILEIITEEFPDEYFEEDENGDAWDPEGSCIGARFILIPFALRVLPRALVEAIDALAYYPALDESRTSEIEHEEIREQLDDYALYDTIKKFDEIEREALDEAESQMLQDDYDEQVRDAYWEACSASDNYPQHAGVEIHWPESEKFIQAFREALGLDELPECEYCDGLAFGRDCDGEWACEDHGAGSLCGSRIVSTITPWYQCSGCGHVYEIPPSGRCEMIVYPETEQVG